MGMWSRRLLAVACAGAVLVGAAAAAPQQKSGTAPARRRVKVTGPAGELLTADVAKFKTQPGKILLTFSGSVQAKAPDVELLHADRATAEVDSRWRWTVIRASGSVRLTMRQTKGGQTEKATGRCDQATLHNPAGRKITGDERVLVADLSGSVVLTMARGDAEPMTLEGEHAQVWQTADGLEGQVTAE